jgi:hypothetical protein
MKILIMLLLLVGCTKKYQTYHTIKKNSFKFPEQQSLITPKMYPGRKVSDEACVGQFFFNNNAKKESEEKLNSMVRYTCPKQEYLLNSKVTETWWTTIIYSRACIKLETFCPLESSRK